MWKLLTWICVHLTEVRGGRVKINVNINAFSSQMTNKHEKILSFIMSYHTV